MWLKNLQFVEWKCQSKFYLDMFCRRRYVARTSIPTQFSSSSATSFASGFRSTEWKVLVFNWTLLDLNSWRNVKVIHSVLTSVKTFVTICKHKSSARAQPNNSSLPVFAAILVIYLTQWLNFHDNDATAIFHAFSMLCYFLPLFGGIISDSCLGKYKWGTRLKFGFHHQFAHCNFSCPLVKLDFMHDFSLFYPYFLSRTILYLSIIYCIGNTIMSLTALPPPQM